MERQYRMLRGHGNAGGYARGNGDGGTVNARGLALGAAVSLYRMQEGRAALCDQGKADGQGCVCLKYAGTGTLFLTDGEGILLWEDGPEQAQRCLQARNWLSGEIARERAREEKPEPPPVREKEHPGPPQAAPAETPPPEEAPDTRTEAAERPESGEAPVDALPELHWPEGAAELKPYFDQGDPIAPFDAPGWRFVRAPSPLRGIPYCAVGYCARDNRVEQVAYAVPGTPLQAPGALPGYRYQVGREGRGYWTLWRRLPPEREAGGLDF